MTTAYYSISSFLLHIAVCSFVDHPSIYPSFLWFLSVVCSPPAVAHSPVCSAVVGTHQIITVSLLLYVPICFVTTIIFFILSQPLPIWESLFHFPFAIHPFCRLSIHLCISLILFITIVFLSSIGFSNFSTFPILYAYSTLIFSNTLII